MQEETPLNVIDDPFGGVRQKSDIKTVPQNPHEIRMQDVEVTDMKKLSLIAVITSVLPLAVDAQRRGQQGVAPESLQNPPLAKTESEKRILSILNETAKAGESYLSVPAIDGRMLRVLTEAANAKHVVEIGTSTGVSGMWFCLALEKTGGKLTTFELDPGRAALARTHFKKAGVDQLVTVVEGEAHQNITKLKDPVDVVFIDAKKEGYVDYLNKLLPLVRPGGLLIGNCFLGATHLLSAARVKSWLNGRSAKPTGGWTARSAIAAGSKPSSRKWRPGPVGIGRWGWC